MRHARDVRSLRTESRKDESMSHTPGPWSRNIKPARKYNTVFAGRNTHIAHLSTAGLTDIEIEGNCDLIRAAPELLAALKALLPFAHDAVPPRGHEGPCGPESGCDAICMEVASRAEILQAAHRAIARAEGGA